MIETLADTEEYGIPSENSNCDPSDSSSFCDIDSECSESDLARSRSRGKGVLPSLVYIFSLC